MNIENRLQQILTEEGIPPTHWDSQLELWEGLSNASEKLFGNPYLDKDDLRWNLAAEYQRVYDNVGFSGKQFEGSLRATYLSPMQSSREEYGKYTKNERTLRHFSRALVNLGAWPYLTELFQQVEIPLLPGTALNFERTTKIGLGADPRGVTGCPEALYQLQVYMDKYAGRIGFNFHMEGDTQIISITNVQGVPGGKYMYDQFQQEYGFLPHNYLIRSIQQFCNFASSEMVFRGWRNPKSENADPRFYNTLFRAEGIKQMKTVKKANDTDY